jgi:hypothetical protein
MSSDSKVCLTRRDPREASVNDAAKADSMLLTDSESPEQPVGPYTLRSRLSDELRAASRRHLEAQGDSPLVSIIVAYRRINNYHPRRMSAEPQFEPVDERCIWWRIPGARYFGVTADARLTIHDSTYLRPVVVCLRTFQLMELETYLLITGLQSMSPETNDEP